MSMTTKGSILWIVLLQSRQFALGEVNLLCEFTTMHEDLRAKRASIMHSEMPIDLIANSEKERAQQEKAEESAADDTLEVEKPPKKIKREPAAANKNNWNLKLRAALTGPMKEAGQPSFTKVLHFCKADAYHIFTRGGATCALNAFFGKCFFGDDCNAIYA